MSKVVACVDGGRTLFDQKQRGVHMRGSCQPYVAASSRGRICRSSGETLTRLDAQQGLGAKTPSEEGSTLHARKDSGRHPSTLHQMSQHRELGIAKLTKDSRIALMLLQRRPFRPATLKEPVGRCGRCGRLTNAIPVPGYCRAHHQQRSLLYGCSATSIKPFRGQRLVPAVPKSGLLHLSASVTDGIVDHEFRHGTAPSGTDQVQRSTNHSSMSASIHPGPT
jgi:hypothetical protein